MRPSHGAARVTAASAAALRSLSRDVRDTLSGVTKPAPGSRITCADDHQVIQQRDEVIRDRLRRTTSRYDYLSTLTYLHTSLSGMTRAAPGSEITGGEQNGRTPRVLRQAERRTATHTGPHQTERNTYAAPGRTEHHRVHRAAPDRTEHRRAYRAAPDRTEDLRVCRTVRNGRLPRMPPGSERKNAAHATWGRTEDRRAYRAGQNGRPPRMPRRPERKTATHTEGLTGQDGRPPRMREVCHADRRLRRAGRKMTTTKPCREGRKTTTTMPRRA